MAHSISYGCPKIVFFEKARAKFPDMGSSGCKTRQRFCTGDSALFMCSVIVFVTSFLNDTARFYKGVANVLLCTSRVSYPFHVVAFSFKKQSRHIQNPQFDVTETEDDCTHQ